MDIRIRRFRPDDAPVLRSIFHSSVHTLAAGHYTLGQREAWAPLEYDAGDWAVLLQQLAPYVAEVEGSPVAYGDLQPDGCIDHFYVAGEWGRLGLGNALMAHLIQEAGARGLRVVQARVSKTAEPLFTKWGFQVEARHSVVLRGVQLTNATMRKELSGPPEEG
jgi:putative acetyltransferase